MYNEEQKLKYLATISSDSSRKYVANVFKRLQDEEMTLGIDIADWTPLQIYTSIESMCIFDYGTIKQYLSSLSAYRKYISIERNACDQTDAFFPQKLDVSNIDLSYSIRRILVPSPMNLRDELAKAIELDQGYYIAAAVCFAWLGIDMKLMPLIKDTAVDFSSKSIIDEECGIHITQIDDHIIDILKEYWNTNEAIRYHHAPCKVYPLLNGKFLHIMAGANSEKPLSVIKIKSLQVEFSSLKKKYEEYTGEPSKLEYTNVLRSGGLYRLYQLEKSGVDIYSTKSDNTLLKTYAAPGKPFDIRSLYRQYKRAFNLD